MAENPLFAGLQSASNTYATYDELKRRRRLDALRERSAANEEARGARSDDRQDKQTDIAAKQAATNETRIAEEIRQAREAVARARESQEATGEVFAGMLDGSGNREEAAALLKTGKLSPEAAKVVVGHYAAMDKAEALGKQIDEAVQAARGAINSGKVGSSMAPDGQMTREDPNDVAIAAKLDRAVKGLESARERMNPQDVQDVNRAAAALDAFNAKVESLATEKRDQDKRRAAIGSFIQTANEAKAKYAGSAHEADIAGIMSQIQTDEEYTPQQAHNDLMRVTAKAAGYIPSVRIHGIDIEDPRGDLQARKPVSAKGWSKIQRATAEFIDKNPMAARMAVVPESAWFDLDLQGLEESGAEAMPGDKLAHALKYMRAAISGVKQAAEKLPENKREEAVEAGSQMIQQEFAAVMSSHGLDGLMQDPLMVRQAELILQGVSAQRAFMQTWQEWQQLQREEQNKEEKPLTDRPPEPDWFGANQNVRQPGTRVTVPK